MTERMRRPGRWLGLGFLVCILASLAPMAAADDEPDAVRRALLSGTYGIDLRYRFEAVTDDTPSLTDDQATASTLRTTLFYRSAAYEGLQVFVEVEDVTALGLAHEFDNRGASGLANRGGGEPVIADVEQTAFNQAYLSFDRVERARASVGRFELALDDQRFVGPVGWRQNHQSFDGATLVLETIPRTKLTYAYLHDVHRIFGDHQRMKSHLFHAQIEAGSAGRLAPFAYLLDYDQASAAGQSRLTYGLSFSGKVAATEQVDLPFLLQVAQQTDAGDNPAEIEAGYARIELGARNSSVGVRAGAEILEGNPSDGAFSTPLATLHKFNGWADKFLGTPATGLQDFYVAADGKRGSATATVVFHDFRANSVDAKYGTEIDAQVTYAARWKQGFGAKLALYSADESSADTTKLMVWTTYGF